MDEIQKTIAGCIKKSKADQYRLYALFSKKMFGVCLRFAPSYDEAQDILQEGFIKVFKSLESYAGTGSLEGWMRRIFVNTAIEKYRERVYFIHLDEIWEGEVNAQLNDGPPALFAKDILAFVQRLPAQYRLVFNLFVLEGYSHKEIGRLLGISESTSRSNLARARLLLKRNLNIEHKMVLRAM